MTKQRIEGNPNADWAALPPDAAADWTIPQRWEHFTAEEHRTWDLLFARQQEMLRGRAIDAFHESLDILRLSRPGIPRFDELNEQLHRATGWTVVAVPGRIPHEIFHGHLSKRRFPVGNFIRTPQELDYLKTPDLFHDLFGHVTLLARSEWADLMQRMGHLGLQAFAAGDVMPFARLYWYTVEFGLCRQEDGLRIYGAGIVSSFKESLYALDSLEPRRIRFNLPRVLRTHYRINFLQQIYFVVDDLRGLRDMVLEADLPTLYAGLEDQDILRPTDLIPGDDVFAKINDVGRTG